MCAAICRSIATSDNLFWQTHKLSTFCCTSATASNKLLTRPLFVPSRPLQTSPTWLPHVTHPLIQWTSTPFAICSRLRRSRTSPSNPLILHRVSPQLPHPARLTSPWLPPLVQPTMTKPTSTSAPPNSSRTCCSTSLSNATRPMTNVQPDHHPSTLTLVQPPSLRLPPPASTAPHIILPRTNRRHQAHTTLPFTTPRLRPSLSLSKLLPLPMPVTIAMSETMPQTPSFTSPV